MKWVIIMDKIKKDFIVVYLARNALATLVITVVSFVYNLTDYYNILPLKAFNKLFADNLYTIVYFLLLWILNYLLFEIYKIIVDGLKGTNNFNRLTISKWSVSYGSILPLVVLVILVIIDFNQLFKINFILLVLFMFLRSVKEEMKYKKK